MKAPQNGRGKGFLSSAPWLLIGLALLISFQNCATQFSSDLARRSGNGDGYDGKPTRYVNLDVEGACAGGGSVRNIIEVLDEKAYLVRENCQEIAPVSLSLEDINLMGHNSSVAVYRQKLYKKVITPIGDDLLELYPPSSDQGGASFTELFCRGEKSVSGDRTIYDLEILNSQGRLQGKLSGGTYSDASSAPSSLFEIAIGTISPPQTLPSGSLYYEEAEPADAEPLSLTVDTGGQGEFKKGAHASSLQCYTY
jgi:hypothetical protein